MMYGVKDYYEQGICSPACNEKVVRPSSPPPSACSVRCFGLRKKGEEMPRSPLFPTWADASVARLVHPEIHADDFEVVRITIENQDTDAPNVDVSMSEKGAR